MHEREPETDPNKAASRIIKDLIGRDEQLPAEIEAAWHKWISGIKAIDDRVKTLLRASFEAGIAAERKRSKKDA